MWSEERALHTPPATGTDCHIMGPDRCIPKHVVEEDAQSPWDGGKTATRAISWPYWGEGEQGVAVVGLLWGWAAPASPKQASPPWVSFSFGRGLQATGLWRCRLTDQPPTRQQMKEPHCQPPDALFKLSIPMQVSCSWREWLCAPWTHVQGPHAVFSAAKELLAGLTPISFCG